MKKLFISLLFLAGILSVQAQYKAGYYDKMDGKKREELKTAAKECIAAHTRLGYSALPAYWEYTDIYPDLYNGSQRWWDMYSNNIYLIRGNQTPNSSFSANRMQREHSVPKSWWKKNGDVEYTPAYTDLWNLYPSDGPANQAKSNYPFGITDAPSYNNGLSKVGPAKTGYGGGAGKVFEPGDEYKGTSPEQFSIWPLYMTTSTGSTLICSAPRHGQRFSHGPTICSFNGHVRTP